MTICRIDKLKLAILFLSFTPVHLNADVADVAKLPVSSGFDERTTGKPLGFALGANASPNSGVKLVDHIGVDKVSESSRQGYSNAHRSYTADLRLGLHDRLDLLARFGSFKAGGLQFQVFGPNIKDDKSEDLSLSFVFLYGQEQNYQETKLQKTDTTIYGPGEQIFCSIFTFGLSDCKSSSRTYTIGTAQMETNTEFFFLSGGVAKNVDRSVNVSGALSAASLHYHGYQKPFYYGPSDFSGYAFQESLILGGTLFLESKEGGLINRSRVGLRAEGSISHIHAKDVPGKLGFHLGINAMMYF